MLILYFCIYFLSSGCLTSHGYSDTSVNAGKVYFMGSATPDSHIHKFVLYCTASEVSITICFMLEEWFSLINWHFKVIFPFPLIIPSINIHKIWSMGSGFTCSKFSKRKHSMLKLLLECDMCWLKTFSVQSFVRLGKQTSEHNWIRAL